MTKETLSLFEKLKLIIDGPDSYYRSYHIYKNVLIFWSFDEMIAVNLDQSEVEFHYIGPLFTFFGAKDHWIMYSTYDHSDSSYNLFLGEIGDWNFSSFAKNKGYEFRGRGSYTVVDDTTS